MVIWVASSQNAHALDFGQAAIAQMKKRTETCPHFYELEVQNLKQMSYNFSSVFFQQNVFCL